MNKEEFLVKLTQEVLLPVMKILEKKVDFANIPKLVKKMHLNMLTLLPFSDKANEEIIKIFENRENLEKIYNLGLSQEDVILIFSYLYCRLKMFIDKNNYQKFAIKYNDLFHKICEILLSYQEEDNQKETKKDDFLEISSKQEESIQNMHYKDEEKISAEEFMKQEEFDEDLIVDIKDLLEDYDNMKYKYNNVSYEFINSVKEVLSKFSALFILSGEFKDLARVIEGFLSLLNELDIQTLSDAQKNFLKMFIDAFMGDLNKWYEEVILYKSAIDIHYLDASIMSSIQQIEAFFGKDIKN